MSCGHLDGLLCRAPNRCRPVPPTSCPGMDVYDEDFCMRNKEPITEEGLTRKVEGWQSS